MTFVISKLKTWINPVKAIIAKIKPYLYGAVVIAIISLSASTYHLYNKSIRLDKELGSEINNRRQYEAISNGLENDNRSLQLHISDLRHSNDSLIKSLDETRKSLRIKENDLKWAVSQQTVIRDTITEYLPIEVADTVDFTTVLKPNDLTTFTIVRDNLEITCIPEIYNGQSLFIYSKKEYRHPDKNFFQRLFTFDWKKDKINRYEILNSNPIIQTTETRVIEIID